MSSPQRLRPALFRAQAGRRRRRREGEEGGCGEDVRGCENRVKGFTGKDGRSWLRFPGTLGRDVNVNLLILGFFHMQHTSIHT